MPETLSLHGLAARLWPARYVARYREDLATDLGRVLLPGETTGRPLEQLYVPLHFREVTPAPAAAPVASARAMDIWDVLFRAPRVAIVGEPGAGKTITLRHVAATLAQGKMPETYVRRLTFLHQGQASNQLLPVYADLGQLDQQAGDWAAALADSLAQHGFPGAADFLRAALKEGKCLLLLDGGTALSVPELARLTELLDTYPKVQVLLATRRKEVAAALAGWMCFEPLPFSTDDAQTFVDRRLGKDSPAAQALLQALERSSGLRSLAQNPLLLSTLAWASSSIQRSPLPQTDLYEWCLQVLLEKDRSSAGSQAPSAQDSDTRNLALQEIGYRLHVRRRDSFALGEWESVAREVLGQLGHADKEDDLLTLPERTRLFRRDGDESYAFLRLGLQEFLAAKTVAATGRLSDIVSQYADDPWWHEVIVLAAGQQEGAAEVVSQMVEQSATEQAVFLAARCAAEVPSIAPELKKKLHDGLWQIFEADDETGWQTAAVCIAALSGQRVRDYFQSMLKEGSLGERERAALVMGLVGGSEWATVPLLGALDRTRPRELRRRAAWALGQLGDKRAVPALLETLQDAQEEVANEAAMALGAVGEAAIPVLIQALGSDQRQVRRLAIQALGKVGDKAQRPLVNALQDEKQADETVRGAAEALGLLGDAQVIPYLTPLLRARGGKLAESAARALASVGPPAVQPLIEALPTQSADLALRGGIVDALVAIGESSIPALIQALNNPSTPVRNAAEEALTRIGRPATEALVGALRTENWDLRRRVAQILGQIGDRSLAEPLVQVLQDPDPGVRARTAHILGRIGQEEVVVEPLISIVRSDPDDFVRHAAIKALGELHAQRAVTLLIQVLEHERLRDAAVAALGEIGQEAVEPLIAAVNESEDPTLQQACVKALGLIGVRGHLERPDLFGVAKTYALLFTENPALEQMVALLQNMRWWAFGEELCQVFSTVQVLLQAQNLRAVAQCAAALAWVEHVEHPFRPALKRTLRDLNSVVQSVHLYLHDTRREGQRDAMLSAINAIREIRKAIDEELLGFEKRPFADVVEGWQHLMDEAIQNLRGRAQLDIMPLRADLPMDAASPTAMVVFRLTNLGDSAARNLSVTLKRSGRDGFEIVGEATQQLYPLGSGMQRDVEFWIKPLGGNEASYVFEVIYDDDEGTGHFYPTSGRLRFFVVGDEYRPIPTSPYVMGPPVKTQHMFYGRRDVFDWIAENVSGVEQENILILHGERRMGKTSILYQLLERPPSPEYICVFFSLELAVTTSLGDLFYDMATAIQEELARHGVHVLEPSEPEFLRHTQRAFRRFLDTVEAGLGERRLLVMIDEIDILIAKVEEQVLSADAFHLMRGIMQHSAKVAFIVTGAYRAREMLKDNKSILFNIARSYKISYLNEKEAEALIVEPVAEYLTYDNMVVNKILRVTACHPYFVQYICDSLVKLAQRMRKNWVYLPDIEVVLQEVIQDNTGVLQNAVYAPLSKPEQKVLAALANVTDDRTIYVPPEVGAELLDKHGLEVEKTQLLAALRALCERDLVDEKRMGQSLQYGFRMDLIRMWLRQNETLLRLSQEARI